MKIRSDEPDTMVIDDIPDDVMVELERKAALAGSSIEDFVRGILIAGIVVRDPTLDRPIGPKSI